MKKLAIIDDDLEILKLLDQYLTKNVFLHLNGSDKLHTLELAMTNKDAMKMPIYYFLEKGLKIYWSP